MIEENRKKELLRRIRRLSDYHEIQNEMGRFIAAVNFRQPEKVKSFFALEKEDVSLEYADEGEFRGRKAVEACVDMLMGKPYEPGEMTDIQLTTPIIEVAQDGETARAVWWSPGAGSLTGKGEPQAVWMWGDFAVDFIRINEQWKIWHLHYFRLILCDYHKGWVEDTSMINRPNTPMHPLSSPSTYHDPYSPLAVRKGIPAAPYPYDTYREEERYWMLRSDKTK